MRPETTADRLNQKVLVWSPETPAHDTRALAANIDRVAISNLLLSAIESFTNIVFGMRVSRREGEALVTGFLFNISGNVGPGDPTVSSYPRIWLGQWSTKGQWVISQVELSQPDQTGRLALRLTAAAAQASGSVY
jgi:hypothetical protein